MNELTELAERNTSIESAEYKDTENHIQIDFTQNGGFSVGVPYELQNEGWEITHVLGKGNSNIITVHFRKEN